MQDTVKQRLIKYLKNRGIGQTKFEEIAGLSRGYITNLKKDPTTAKLLMILSAAPDLNQQWLLTGEGSMLVDDNQPPDTPQVPDIQLVQSNAVQSQDVTDVEYAGENHNAGVFFRDKHTGQLYISVPHVPYAARGEFPNLADSLEPLSEWGREVYAVDRKANGRYISFDIRGDSMDNGMRRSLQDGDKGGLQIHISNLIY